MIYKQINAVGVRNRFNTKINPATEETLKGVASFGITNYDSIDLTYVQSGNGVGEVETVTYKKDGNTIATLTLSYDPDSNVVSVNKT